MLKPLLTITTSRYIPVNDRVADRVEQIGVTEYVKQLLEEHDYTELEPYKVSRDPWLYDPRLTPEEIVYWKLKGVCHECKISARHHRDDCCFSANQLMFAQLENIDHGLNHINKYVEAIIGHKIKTDV